jgi:zinc transporter, ZIP family
VSLYLNLVVPGSGKGFALPANDEFVQAHPIGAGIAYLALRVMLGGESGGIPSQVLGILFGGAAGIMVCISLDELLPASRAYGKGHDSVFGLFGGMLIMALSLLLMK